MQRIRGTATPWNLGRSSRFRRMDRRVPDCSRGDRKGVPCMPEKSKSSSSRSSRGGDSSSRSGGTQGSRAAAAARAGRAVARRAAAARPAPRTPPSHGAPARLAGRGFSLLSPARLCVFAHNRYHTLSRPRARNRHVSPPTGKGDSPRGRRRARLAQADWPDQTLRASGGRT